MPWHLLFFLFNKKQPKCDQFSETCNYRRKIAIQVLDFALNNNDYLEDLITRSTYHSNAIEGNTLTYAETYAILYNDNTGLAEWLKELYTREKQRMKKFGYSN